MEDVVQISRQPEPGPIHFHPLPDGSIGCLFVRWRWIQHIDLDDMVCSIDVTAEKVVLTLGASISLICLFAVFVIYYCLDVPHLRRHSTG